MGNSSNSGSFERWDLGWGRTQAYRLFKRHHTQLNSFYWSHASALRYVFAATRNFKREDHSSSLFAIAEDDMRRINYSLGEWGKNYDEFDNWVRLNAIVGITGYLEVYMKTVTRLALESDPGLLIGASHSVDGVRLLKVKPKYSYAEDVVPCVRGTWHERLANYLKLFGHVPQELFDALPQLEKLRKIRNGVTHTFGRSSDDYDSLLEVQPKNLKRVDEKYLKETLRLVDKLALVIDIHLGESHVGEYETLYFYHHWDKKYPKAHRREEKVLGTLVNRIHHYKRIHQYYVDLVAHYNRV